MHSSQLRERQFSKFDIWYLAILTSLAAIGRILYQYDRPFVNDEVGTLMYLDRSFSFLLSHFESWLTMNYFITAEKVMAQLGGSSQVSLIIIPLGAGIAIVPLTALLARRVSSRPVALISATLVAANPYLFFYSGNIRSYSLLAMFCVVVLILLLDWRAKRTLMNGIFVALACCALVLSHLNGLYVVAYVILIAGADAISAFRTGGKSHAATLLVPLAIGLLLMVVAYARLYPALREWGIPYHDAPPTSVSYLAYSASQYFGTGFYGWLSILLLAVGILSAYRQDLPARILAPFLVLPIALISAQGISHFPWAYTRFLIFLLPVCIIFMAQGASTLASRLGRENVLTALLAGLVVASWLPGLVDLFQRKADFPWNQVAAYINTRSDEGDVILYRSSVESLNLYPYFAHSAFVQSIVSEYSAEEGDRSAGHTLFLVRGEPVLVSDYPSRVFGKIQVIAYPGSTYAQELITIRDELIKSNNSGEVSPDFADDYWNIWAIGGKLGEDVGANFRYYQLYMYCLQLTERQRNIPISLQYWYLKTAGLPIMNAP